MAAAWGTSLIGCGYLSTGDVCGGTYHPYWAIDLGLGRGVGDPVFAAGGGVAHIGGTDPACGVGQLGTWVWVEHPDNVVSTYFHLNSITITDGQEVDQNTQLGTVGFSGDVEPCTAGAAHLHFEKRVNGLDGESVDPGQLKACHASALVVDPNDAGFASWQGYEGHVANATSDGTGCESPFGEGKFVQDADTGDVFRMAGGAPIYVSSWDEVGGEQEVTVVSHADILALPVYPAAGIFIRGFTSGEIYRIAGDAPVFVSSWDAVGGEQPVIDVDATAIAQAGSGGVYNHLRFRPVNGAFVSSFQSGRVFRMAGGAPVYVSTWDAVGGEQPVVAIDQAAIEHARESGPWVHLRHIPHNGTYVIAYSSGKIFHISGGAPVYVSKWAAVGGEHPAVEVDAAAIKNAASGGRWNHLRYYPQDDARLVTLNDRMFRVRHGIAHEVPGRDVAAVDSKPVLTDLRSILKAGGDRGPLSHLRGRRLLPPAPSDSGATMPG